MDNPTHSVLVIAANRQISLGVGNFNAIFGKSFQDNTAQFAGYSLANQGMGIVGPKSQLEVQTGLAKANEKREL